jgi:hypothetical protein
MGMYTPNIANVLNKLATRNTDMRQRRVVNASPSQAPTDCVIKSELTGAVNNLNSQINNLANSIPSSIYYENDYTLTSSGTTIPSPVYKPGKKFWLLFIQQDGTGGRTFSFDTNTSAVSSGIDTTAGTLSAFLLVYRKSTKKWVFACQPTTGMAL